MQPTTNSKILTSKETFHQIGIPMKEISQTITHQKTNSHEYQYDRLSDGLSSNVHLSPTVPPIDEGFSRMSYSAANSPFIPRSRFLNFQANDFKDRLLLRETSPELPGTQITEKTNGFKNSLAETLTKNQSTLNLSNNIFFKKSQEDELSHFANSTKLKSNQNCKLKNPSQSCSDDKHPASENDEDGPADKRKSHKGLKSLSIIVRDIVIEKRLTTYKEVAEIILRDTIREEQMNSSHKIEILKEEQNIKRRVYDALNVLISAGVLVKDGKKVRKNENMNKMKINMKRCQINSVNTKIVK